jgi:hypothetical protein
MNHAARTNPSQMTRIFMSLPQYHFYGHLSTATKHERSFRMSLGHMLQEVAERLLNSADSRGTGMNHHQQESLENVVEDVGTLITLLNRRGTIQLGGTVSETIAMLRDLDNKLIMLLEQVWHMSQAVLRPDCNNEAFDEGVQYLTMMLEAFADTAEERNQLLGLGWESEFGMSPMPKRK